MKMRAGLLSMVIVAVSSGVNTPTAHSEPVPVIKPVVVAVIPHDPAAYTEGLELDGTALYEGTGLAGKSQLRELDPTTGAVRRSVAVPGDYFGEGITVVGDRIWQLTYRDGVAVEWDKHTLTPVREVPLAGERWGVCKDGGRLVVSDGTDQLRFLDPATLAEVGAVSVRLGDRRLFGLNELECVDGQVWANAWPTDAIVRIDPAAGVVNAVVDAAGLWPRDQRTRAQVMSGIAHLGGQEYLLGGKNWPAMYRVRINL
jgi:glutaminyl-peptide cyclotransferase